MGERPLAKNTLYFTLASIAQKVIALGYFTVISNVIGTSQNGMYFLALGIATILAVFEDIGLTSVAVREVAKHPEDAGLWTRTVLGWKCFSIPLSIGLAFLIPVLFGYTPELTTLVHLAIFVMIADTFSLSLYGILRGLHTLRYESLGIFLGQSMTALTGLAFVYFHVVSLPLLFVAVIAGSVWNVLFSLYHLVHRLGWGILRPSFELGWTPIRLSFAFFLSAVFVKVYSYADSFILNEILGEASVGIYAVAYKFTYAFQFLPLAFIAALYPAMSAEAHDRVALKKTFLDSMWYIALMVFPIVGGIFALAPEIIRLFFKEEFWSAGLPLQVLIFALLFIFLDYPIGSLLNASGRQNTKTAIMGVTMVLNIVTNLIFIPLYGIFGACFSALISFAFMFFSGWIVSQNVLRFSVFEFLRRTWGIILSATVMVMVVLVVKSSCSLFFIMPLGALVYGFGLLLTRTITADHYQRIRSILTRKSYVEDHPLHE
ncbi:MAG: flippase [Patescibacteria group bacterium]